MLNISYKYIGKLKKYLKKNRKLSIIEKKDN